MDQISVVIPTHERLPALANTLTALAEQDLAGVDVELIVVCSDSSASYRDRVDALVSGLPFRSRVLARADGGAAGARNTGVEAADGDLVLFLNDDTPPLHPDLVRSHVAIHAADPDEWRGVQGRSVWGPGIEVTPVMDWLSRTGKMHDYAILPPGASRTPMLYANNLSVHRAAIDGVGGFDERFSRYGWEEYDLALRLVDRGFSLWFDPELVVGHLHRYTLRDSLQRMDSMGHAANLFNRVHGERPELVTPAPAGAKALVGRLIAPLAARVPVPDWLPRPVRDATFRVLHWATLARGYARAPLPDGH